MIYHSPVDHYDSRCVSNVLLADIVEWGASSGCVCPLMGSAFLLPCKFRSIHLNGELKEWKKDRVKKKLNYRLKKHNNDKIRGRLTTL